MGIQLDNLFISNTGAHDDIQEGLCGDTAR